MRWNVYDVRGNRVGRINGQTRTEALIRAQQKFGLSIEAVLNDDENEQLRILLLQQDQLE